MAPGQWLAARTIADLAVEREVGEAGRWLRRSRRSGPLRLRARDFQREAGARPPTGASIGGRGYDSDALDGALAPRTASFAMNVMRESGLAHSQRPTGRCDHHGPESSWGLSESGPPRLMSTRRV